MKTCRLKIITANIIEETDSPQIHYVSQNKKPKINSDLVNNKENINLIHNIEENIIQKEKLEKITEEKSKISNEEITDKLQNINLENPQENQINNNNIDVNIDINDLCTISNQNNHEEQKINNIYNNINNCENNLNNNNLNNNYPYEIMNKKKVLNISLRCLFKNRTTKNNNKNANAYKSLSVSKISNGANKLNSKKNSKNNSKTNLYLNQSINKSLCAKNDKNNKSKNSVTLSSKKSANHKKINRSANNSKKNGNVLRGRKKNGNIGDGGTSVSGGTTWKVVEKNDMNIGQIIDYKSLIDDLIIKECQLVKEKEDFMQIFENKLKPLREMNEKLINDNNEELDKEDELNGELILLKNQYDNLFNSLNMKNKNIFKDKNFNKNKIIDDFNIKYKEIEEEMKILNDQLINGEFILITKPADYYELSEEEDKSITFLLKGLFYSLHILDTDIIIDSIWKKDKQFQMIYFIVEELLNYFHLEHKSAKNILINYFYSFCKNYSYMNKTVFKKEFKKKIGTIRIFNKYIYMSKLINYHNSTIKSLLVAVKKKDIFKQGIINYDQFISYLYDFRIIVNDIDVNFEELLEFLIYCMKKNRKLDLFDNEQEFLDNKSEKDKKNTFFDLYYDSLKDFLDEYNSNYINNGFYLIRNYMKANDIINAENLFAPIINQKNILKKNSKEYIDIIVLNKYLRYKEIIKNDDKIIVDTFEEELVDINQFINDIYNDNENEEKQADYEELKEKANNLVDEILKLNY
jgi:hypothetical protein